MKVGILGSGFGSYHAKLYKGVEGIDSIKLFGRNEEKLKQIKEELKIEVTNDIFDIINDPEIDLVDICLPTKEHCQYIIEALKGGKNVFCETPLCYSLEEAKLIMAAEKLYGKKVYVDLFIKFSPEYQYLHELLQNNTYGALKSLSIIRKTPPIWGDLGFSTIIPNLMLHDLDLVVWFLGMPIQSSVEGVSSRPLESHVTASFRFRDAKVEVVASSMMPKSYPFTVGFEAIFENGMVEYHEYFTHEGSVKTSTEYAADGKKELSFGDSILYELAIKHVIACCKENKETVLSVQDAAKSLEIAFNLRDMLVQQNETKSNS
jgi:predicted dehydrogenase